MMNTNTHRINADRHNPPPPAIPDAVVMVTVTSSVQFVAMTSVGCLGDG